MVGRLSGALKFGIFIGLLFTIISIYIPKAVTQSCDVEGTKQYSVLGFGPISSPGSDKCGEPNVQDQLIESAKSNTDIVNASSEVIDVSAVKEGLPIKETLKAYIDTDYMDSKSAMFKNFVSYSLFGALFFLLFGKKRLSIFN